MNLLAAAFAATLSFTGGWYGDSCPNGDYVSLRINSHLDSSRGRVELPGQAGNNLLQVRLNCAGAFRFAGTGHIDGNAWEFENGQWRNLGPSFGINPVIYDNAGNLHVVRQAGSFTGSLGWRYVDSSNRLIATWETYDPSTSMSRERAISGLWEWTECGGIYVGQGGDEGGVQALIAGRRVLLDAGVDTFIRCRSAEGRYAVAYVRQDTGETRFIWATRGELDALPTYIPGEIHEPPPPPPPPPFSCGELSPQAQVVLKQLAVKFEAEIRSNDDDQRRQWALRAAQQLAFSVDPGFGTKRASEGRPPSKDGVAKIVSGKLCGWDVVNGSTRDLQFGPGMNLTDPPDGPQVFIRVDPVNYLGEQPPPPPPPVKCDVCEANLSKALTALAEARAEVDGLKASVDALTADAILLKNDRDRLEAELAAERAKPEPRLVCSRIFGISYNCRIER